MLPFYESWDSDFHAFEWTSSHSFLPHLHHELELMYVAQGSIDVEINFERQRLEAGDLAVILPHSVHAYDIPVPAPETVQLWGMVIAPSLTGDFAPHINGAAARHPFLTAAELEPAAVMSIEGMFHTHYGARPLVVRAYLQLLLACIWPTLAVEPSSDRQAEDMLFQVIQYMLEHYRQPLQAKDVAAQLGVSTSYLARIFSRRLHMSFNDYINRLRVQAAQDLLRSTDRPVTEVMLEVGFESQSTFNRVFRDIQGITPREYRQQTRQ